MKPTRTKQYPEYRIAPYLRRRKPKRHWSEDIRLWRKFELGLGIIAILALGFAIYGNYQADIGLEQAREEAKENRIVNAWQILSNRSPGNTGKKAALETLNNAEENLRGIDLSCATMDGMDENTKSCDTPTFLANLSLPNANLIGANLSHANLWGANLSDANISWVNLSDANLSFANLSDAILFRANLSDADLGATNLGNANLRETNLSNVNFCDSFLGCAKKLTQPQIDKAWAWADSPQVFKARHRQLDLKPPPLCPIKLRSEYEAEEKTGKPDGC